MNNDLISRSKLIKNILELPDDTPTFFYSRCLLERQKVLDLIDNAPAVDTTEQEEFAYNEGYAHGLETKRPQGEITNDDIQQAIKEGFANGYEMAKEKIIHSIAEQYSAHNELVPIWLSIGDIKGGAE